MTIDERNQADRANCEAVVSALKSSGFEVCEPQFSTNRYNQNSFYFMIKKGSAWANVRLSDHSSNWVTAHVRRSIDVGPSTFVEQMKVFLA